MTKEKPLSEKKEIMEKARGNTKLAGLYLMYHEEDVKEAVERLKEELDKRREEVYIDTGIHVDNEDIIDSIFGRFE